MGPQDRVRLAIVFPGDEAARRSAAPETTRFADLFLAFAARGAEAEPAVYNDDISGEVREQLLRCDAVLVWVNPIEGGRDRTVLDALLRDVAAHGVFVSSHPDVILKLGTKDVLYETRNLGWGCDTYRYTTIDQLRHELPRRLADGEARVLKQYRGNGGDGVWRVQLPPGEHAMESGANANALPRPDTLVRVRHAKRGSVEELIRLAEFYERCAPYFAVTGGRVIDQAWQERLPEGMTRCYLVHDRVAGFGHQAINALYPAPPGEPPADAPMPGPRLYHPPDKPEFQPLKAILESEWVPALRRHFALETAELPILWDCDFLLGPKDAADADTYVLCEINVSSVAPYPESAVPFIVDATLAAARRPSR